MPILAVEKGVNKGAECKLPKEGEILIGRSSVCQLQIADAKASRQHCRVEVRAGKIVVTDLDSHNGTFVNKEKIALPTAIKPGDEILIGEALIRVTGDEPASLIGTELGGYRLEQRLGEGGMGDVYKATQVSLGRTVAVKVLSEDLSRDQSFVGRFLEEARAAGRLNHANIVHVHEVGQDKGRYFYAMEYVSGGNVHDLVEGGQTLDPPQATKMIHQAAKALEYAEKEGIVHCDIKPENLMVTADGDIRLADLGIAKRSGDLPTADDGEGVFGSPHYMSPEQSRGEPVDNRSDLYSLGCSFYRLLAGRPPFDGKTGREIMEKQVYEAPKSIRKLNPGIPGVLSVIVMKLLQKKPEDRYQTAAALIRDLEHARGVIGKGGGPLAQRVTGRQVRVREGAGLTLTVIFGGATVVAAIVGVVMLAGYLNEPQEMLREAMALEQAGDLELALKVYKRASIKGGGGEVGVAARKRIDSLQKRLERERMTKGLEEKIDRIRTEVYAGGKEIAAGLAALSRVSEGSALAKDLSKEAIEELTEKLRRAALAELEKRRSDAQAMTARMEYGRAVALFEEFPEYYAGTASSDEAKKEAATARQRAHDDLAAAVAKAEDMVEKAAASPGAAVDAIRLITPFLEKAGLQDITTAAEAARRKIEKRAQDIQDGEEEKKRASRVEEADWQVRLSRMQTHLYRFPEARSTARYAQVMLRQLGEKQRVTEIEERVNTIKQLEILFDLLLTALERNTLKRSELKLPYKGEARLVGVRRRSGEFILRAGGEDLLTPYGRVPPGELVKVFKGMDLYADDHVPLAEFCMEFGLVEEAYAQLFYFDRVRSAKERADKVRGFVEEGRSDIDDAQDAETLAKLAIEHAQAGRVDEARRALGILRYRYGDTPSAEPMMIARIVKAMRAGKKAGD